MLMERCTSDATDLATAKIIHALELPAFLFSNDGFLAICNSAAQGIIQNSPTDALTLSSSASIHLIDLIALGNTSRNHVPITDDLSSYPVEYFAPQTGQRFSLNWSSLLYSSQQYTLLLMVDLTERDQVQFHKQTLYEALFQTSRALSVGEMATVLAHELNQPLGAILNYLSTARRRIPDDLDRVKQAIDMAASQAEQASSVISRIREFVRSSAPSKAPCLVRDLIDRVMTLLQLEIQHHQVRIEIDLTPELPEVLVDAVMIELVLVNLVKNAIEAVAQVPQAERCVLVSAKTMDTGRVRLWVSDTGPGVLSVHRQQLFTPFFSTKHQGMGAGLAICRSIVEFHGGQLFLDDAAPDLTTTQKAKGARFVCVLPSVPSPSSTPRTPAFKHLRPAKHNPLNPATKAETAQ